MSGLKLKLKKRGDKLEKTRKALNLLGNPNVRVGHFSEQGTHSDAKVSYPRLMKWHHTGRGGYPERPVLRVLWFRNKKLLKSPELIRAMKVWLSGDINKQTTQLMLSTFGKHLVKKEKAIMGSSGNMMPPSTSKKRIGVEGPTAPLVDSGELKSKVAYKTSITNKVEET